CPIMINEPSGWFWMIMGASRATGQRGCRKQRWRIRAKSNKLINRLFMTRDRGLLMPLVPQRGDRSTAVAAPPKREQALYVQLAERFRRRIASKDWPIGLQLPPVEDLAIECGVARITVRQAMNILLHEGLVSRARRRGTHVLKEPVVLRVHHMT